MNRINELGMNLIEYKIELFKDYPKLVLDSLVLSIEKMLEVKAIDLDTFMLIKDDTVDIDSFKEYLLTKPNFSKTEEQLREEFEKIREKLNELLISNELENYETESNIDKDIISVSKKYVINEKFAMNYFGVDEKEILKLMKRKEFIEKFAVLRLTKILSEIVSMLDMSKSRFFKNDSSLVYFNEEEEGYCIDLIFEIDIKSIENEIDSQIFEEIKYSTKKADDIYYKKMEI